MAFLSGISIWVLMFIVWVWFWFIELSVCARPSSVGYDQEVRLRLETGWGVRLDSAAMKRIVIFLLILVFRGGLARGDDWPQWLGPHRDGIWREQGILKAFPSGGPKVRWRAPVGAGY